MELLNISVDQGPARIAEHLGEVLSELPAEARSQPEGLVLAWGYGLVIGARYQVIYAILSDSYH